MAKMYSSDPLISANEKPRWKKKSPVFSGASDTDEKTKLGTEKEDILERKNVLTVIHWFMRGHRW